tara:strand:+ start:963 stop:1754 length:792 start_codon:yes stop_codon:yes gene_type:complete
MTRKVVYILFLFTSFLLPAETLSDQYIQSIDVDNMLGKKITKSLEIVNDKNEKVTIGNFFNREKPVVMIMAYYRCPMLCSMVLNGLSDAINTTGLAPGEDFDVLTVSIDPTENTELALNKKKNYINEYFDGVEKDFWTFSTTTAENIDILTNELGFRYSYDEKTKQYAHPAVIYVLTPDGIVSRQLFGINPDSKDLFLAINEANANNISSIYDKVLLYCYRYDPNAGSYTLVATNVMKLAGVSTIVFLLSFLSFFWYRERVAK